MSEYVVELRNITKRFPGVVALKSMSIQIRPGEIHGLIGENGAGLGGERLFGLIAAREMVRKAWLRLRIFDNACDLVGQAHEIESHRAMVHGARPLELLNVSLP